MQPIDFDDLRREAGAIEDDGLRSRVLDLIQDRVASDQRFKEAVDMLACVVGVVDRLGAIRKGDQMVDQIRVWVARVKGEPAAPGAPLAEPPA